ncbi:MAG: cyclic nucleotide-binding domain-containing protein [Desulfobulbaceae bacterium]|nr:cyclic nucleotide-binding domain-containing protein [Desulfobulbaceae bacterium]MCK5339814.1 cyclic nucleotide-binding domain-containing protein [Desulfobulbaceae bacterium]MCK5403792.1 cyclic nucleotide-binding domain-containing protein [Desulfobulbaceae bacterium]
MNIKKMLDILNRLDFFSDFTDQEKKIILSYNAQFCVFRDDEKIITMGELDAALFILLAGSVEVTLDDPDKPITILNPGDIIGEMSFLTEVPRTTNITAIEDVITLKIDNAMLNRLAIEIREKIKDKVIQKLVSRLIKMNEEIISLTF